MFCHQCGTAIADTATVCASCQTPVKRAAPVSAGAATSGAVADTVKSASRDALAAFKSFAGNPVGGLAAACEALGEAKALRTGIAFGVVSLLCFLLGGYGMVRPFLGPEPFRALGFGGVMKCLLFAVVPFACTAAGSAAVRKVFGGRGSAGGDCFIAGAALLPISFSMLLNWIVGVANFEVIAVVSVVAGCTAILMLFAGYTRISHLTERAGTLAVPIVVLLTAWLSKVIFTSVMSGGGGYDMSGGFGGNTFGY